MMLYGGYVTYFNVPYPNPNMSEYNMVANTWSLPVSAASRLKGICSWQRDGRC